VFLDGFHLNVRLARRVVSVQVLAALGVTETGQKCLLRLQLAVSEAAAEGARVRRGSMGIAAWARPAELARGHKSWQPAGSVCLSA